MNFLDFIARRPTLRSPLGKRRGCRIGKSCGASCIERRKDCLIELSDPVSGQVSRLAKAIIRRSRDPVEKKLDTRAKNRSFSLRGEKLSLPDLQKVRGEWLTKFKGSRIEDRTTPVTRRILARHDGTHVALQSYLNRSSLDVARMSGLKNIKSQAPRHLEEALVEVLQRYIRKYGTDPRNFQLPGTKKEVREQLESKLNHYFNNPQKTATSKKKTPTRLTNIPEAAARLTLVMDKMSRRADFSRFLETLKRIEDLGKEEFPG